MGKKKKRTQQAKPSMKKSVAKKTTAKKASEKKASAKKTNVKTTSNKPKKEQASGKNKQISQKQKKVSEVKKISQKAKKVKVESTIKKEESPVTEETKIIEEKTTEQKEKRKKMFKEIIFSRKSRVLITSSILIIVIVFSLCQRVFCLEEPKQDNVIKASAQTQANIEDKLPALYEFGANECLPCIQMKPVLAALRELYKGKVNIIFVDTSLAENSGAQRKYKYRFEPTQIIFDKEGNELFRHAGFWAKHDIEQKFLELGLISEIAKPVIKAGDKESGEDDESDGIAATFFNNLERWIKDNIWLGMLVVFAWGLLSVIFSPCQLSTIPLVVGYVGGYTTGGLKKSFLYSSAFVIGIFVPMFLFALFLYQVMYMLQDVGPLFFGGLLILMGLYLLNVLPMNFKPPATKKEKKGALGALILGGLYGIFVTGPCSLAFMAPVLGIVEAGEHRIYGIALIFIFSVSHCLPILAAGTATGWVNNLLSSKKMGSATKIFRFATGLLIFLLGFYFLALR